MTLRTPDQLLAGHTVLKTRDPRDFHRLIAGMEGPHERLVEPGQPVELELRQVSLGRIQIGLLHCNVPMTVRAESLRSDSFLVQFPLDAGADLVIDGESFTLEPGDGLVISPMQQLSRAGRGGWTLVFRLAGAHVRSRLEARLGSAPPKDLRFRSLLGQNAGELRDFALLVVEAVDRGVAAEGGHIAAVLEDGFLDLLLALQPHTPARSHAPATRRARASRLRALEDFVDAHLAEPLGIDALAAAAGCGARTIQETIRCLCDATPMEFVRHRRLAAAHALLQRAGPGTRIADVATRTGFQHLSRFAACYRQRFGESPSATLRRAMRGNTES